MIIPQFSLLACSVKDISLKTIEGEITTTKKKSYSSLKMAA